MRYILGTVYSASSASCSVSLSSNLMSLNQDGSECPSRELTLSLSGDGVSENSVLYRPDRETSSSTHFTSPGIICWSCSICPLVLSEEPANSINISSCCVNSVKQFEVHPKWLAFSLFQCMHCLLIRKGLLPGGGGREHTHLWTPGHGEWHSLASDRPLMPDQ